VDLGRQDHVLTAASDEGLADDLLRLPGRVDVSGVDEVDPGVECSVDDPAAVVVVRIA
jgi:hypothetical protein